MIDPEQLMRKAVAEALADCGLSPGADEEDAEALLAALDAHGYTITKKLPEPEEEEDEEEE